MKRPYFFLLACLLTTECVFAQGYTGDSWAQIKTNKKGTISFAYVETPSFVYKDANGKLTGICVDIMIDFVKWVNDTKGVALDSKFVGDGSNFKTMYDKTKASVGGVFGLGNITITEERKREVKFGPPFINNFAILTTQSAIPTLAKMTDISKTFAGLTAYTAKGTVSEKRMADLKTKYFPSMKITLTATSLENMQKVISDPNGFSYLDIGFFLEALKLNKSMKRHPVGDEKVEQFGFMMPQNSDWPPVLEEFFNANGGYVNSARYKGILQKHLGETGLKLLQSAAK